MMALLQANGALLPSQLRAKAYAYLSNILGIEHGETPRMAQRRRDHLPSQSQTARRHDPGRGAAPDRRTRRQRQSRLLRPRPDDLRQGRQNRLHHLQRRLQQPVLGRDRKTRDQSQRLQLAPRPSPRAASRCVETTRKTRGAVRRRRPSLSGWLAKPSWSLSAAPEGLVPAPGTAVSRVDSAKRGQPSDLAAGHLQGPARTVRQVDHLLSLVPPA